MIADLIVLATTRAICWNTTGITSNGVVGSSETAAHLFNPPVDFEDESEGDRLWLCHVLVDSLYTPAGSCIDSSGRILI